MTELCIQIQPRRSAELNLSRIKSRCEGLARQEMLIRNFVFDDRIEHDACANLRFETVDAKALWGLLRRRIYRSEFGRAVQAASIAICQGQNGWDDYLLLYHYDPEVKCDDFP
jgi:hypothetical protein